MADTDSAPTPNTIGRYCGTASAQSRTIASRSLGSSSTSKVGNTVSS
jgi:hypothetical protein